MLEKSPFVYLPGKKLLVNLNFVASVQGVADGVVLHFADASHLPITQRVDLVSLVQGLAYCSRGLATKQAVDGFIGRNPLDTEGGNE
jgi:hypothetical protein